MAVRDQIREEGVKLGFHRLGFAAVTEIEDDYARYRAFIEAGMHGEMAYLANHQAVRRMINSPGILEGARSVVVCALAYRRDPEQDSVAITQGADRRAGGVLDAKVARYARGRDYHNFFRRRLRKLAAVIQAIVPGSKARAVVDTAPVLERAWARRAGVGFVGKNGCIIVPGLGSFVLLGEVITTADLPADVPMESRCGTCTLCIDACPTSAFAAPFVLDPRRCVSYLTIELRGQIPVELRDGIGNRLFGCDDCQDACPYNRTALPPGDTTEPFSPLPRWSSTSLEQLATLDESAFQALTTGSPLARPKRAGLARNAVVVMGNSGQARYLPTLRAIVRHEPDATVREAAEWALQKLEHSPVAAHYP